MARTRAGFVMAAKYSQRRMTEPLIRNVSDTARWVAVYRALESERRDAVFKDPFARALAGDRGEAIAKAIGMTEEMSWAVVARTHAFDRFVARAVEAGVDLVVNLAAGLDTRPYRMTLPTSLKWVEVDMPEILDYKAGVLASAQPVCQLERVPLDLSNADARRGFQPLGRRPRVAGAARDAEGPNRRSRRAGGRAVPVRPRRGAGVLRALRMEAGRSEVDAENRQLARAPLAEVPLVRDVPRAGRSRRITPVVGRVSARAAVIRRRY